VWRGWVRVGGGGRGCGRRVQEGGEGKTEEEVRVGGGIQEEGERGKRRNKGLNEPAKGRVRRRRDKKMYRGRSGGVSERRKGGGGEGGTRKG